MERPSISVTRMTIRSGLKSSAGSDVGRQYISERSLERPEPGLELPPLFRSLFIKGLAHLLRACRAHAALGRDCTKVSVDASHPSDL